MIKFTRHWQQHKRTSRGLIPENREDPFQVLRPTEAWHSLTNVFQLVSIHTRHQHVCARMFMYLLIKENALGKQETSIHLPFA